MSEYVLIMNIFFMNSFLNFKFFFNFFFRILNRQLLDKPGISFLEKAQFCVLCKMTLGAGQLCYSAQGIFYTSLIKA